jgi:hypothetical protein
MGTMAGWDDEGAGCGRTAAGPVCRREQAGRCREVTYADRGRTFYGLPLPRPL